MSKRKTKILVTGAKSQLGKTLKTMLPLKDMDFKFTDKKTLDISDRKAVKQFFKKNKFDYCFNFAAYTNVNQAETDQDAVIDVNVGGVSNLIKQAKKYNFTLVHISTDYVFDGKKRKPYREDDKVNPLNFYGVSKLIGEHIIQMQLKKYLIVRTSWLYSKYNKNFVKTILELSKYKRKLKLVNDQTGTPTYAPDLVNFLLFLARTIEENPKKNYYGIYHFSNEGKATWYEFGQKILSLAGISKKIKPIDSARFESRVKRPAYSVLSKKKIKKLFDYKPRKWDKALKNFFE